MGRIVVTDYDWFDFLKQVELEKVNFWRKDTRNISSMGVGDRVFFLVKNGNKRTGERLIKGYALFADYNVYSVSEAWDEYGVGNGCQKKKEFLTRLNTLYEDNFDDSKIGCIELTGFQLLKNPITLSDVKIDFSNNIVNTKSINLEEENRIFSLGNRQTSS